MRLSRYTNKLKKTWNILKKDGLIVLLIRFLEKLNRHKHQHIKKRGIHLLVKYEDVLKTDFTLSPKRHSGKKSKPPYTFNWVMSPPGKESGGHQNLFRFIKFLEDAGHKCRIYLYSTTDIRSLSEIKKGLVGGYPKLNASIEWLNEDNSMKPADAVFATGWETAYPVFNSSIQAKRFYFVQDFEPYFYPIGSEYALAENTYRFNFYGITAGGWLAKKLTKDYGMKADNFEFGSDKKVYRLENTKPRKEVFFYARPVTARRAFELGIMALDIFHQKHPDYTINLAGWDVSDYDIPFPYKNLKSMPIDKLSAVYNQCAVALVMSLTNLSLLPLELLACGTIPVVNDGENNRLVSNNKYIAYTPNNPVALAQTMSELVSRKDLPKYAKKAADSVKTKGWQASGDKFVKIVERELSRG